jgi:hypothetical protein
MLGFEQFFRSVDFVVYTDLKFFFGFLTVYCVHEM